jgi:hypothetical protein
MRLATLRTTILLFVALAVDAQVEAPSARAPQRRQRTAPQPSQAAEQPRRQATKRPPLEARGTPEDTTDATRPRGRTSQPAGRTARSGHRRRRRRRGKHSRAGRVLGSLPAAAATVARLAGNASVTVRRLAARLATPAPWAALATNVSRAVLSSRRWASARARTLQDVVGRGAALLHEELAVLRASALWLHLDGGRHRLLLLGQRLGASASATARVGRRRLRRLQQMSRDGGRDPSSDSRGWYARYQARPPPPPQRDVDGRQREQLAQYARVLQVCAA